MHYRTRYEVYDSMNDEYWDGEYRAIELNEKFGRTINAATSAKRGRLLNGRYIVMTVPDIFIFHKTMDEWAKDWNKTRHNVCCALEKRKKRSK